MTDRRSGSRPWTLSWVHVVLALAVGAGLPLLWMVLAPSDERPGVVVAAAAGGQPADPSGVTVIAHAAPQEPAPAAPPVAATVTIAAPQIPRLRDPNGDQTPDIADFINQGEVPTMAEVISRLHAAGVQGGLGAFNPPGTRPPLAGIAVSEAFDLPSGYVRHHQVTDDGQRIEAILMFAPDHPLMVAAEAAGQAAARPQDRVVPPALVPPGMPVRQIVVPTPGGAGNEPRNEPRK